MTQKKQGKRRKRIIYFCIFLCITSCGILLPGYFLQTYFEGHMGEVNTVSPKLFDTTNTALSKHASEKLNAYDRLRLAFGVWDSDTKKVQPDSEIFSQIHAMKLAKSLLEDLRIHKLYPLELNGNYENWYSWDALRYKATDTSFHTYSAYYWKVSFFRYDSDEQHDIYFTEDGILLALTNNVPDSLNPLYPNLNQNLEKYLLDTYKKENRISLFDVKEKKKEKQEDIVISLSDLSTITPKELISEKNFILGNNTITSQAQLESLYGQDMPKTISIYHILACRNTEKFLLFIKPSAPSKR